jgi:ribosomal protein L20
MSLSHPQAYKLSREKKKKKNTRWIWLYRQRSSCRHWKLSHSPKVSSMWELGKEASACSSHSLTT